MVSGIRACCVAGGDDGDPEYKPLVPGLTCHRFMANFFRLLLHTAAMNLLNATRDDLTLPAVLRVGQPCTWRTHVIKVAAVIVQSTRRIVVRLAAHWPWWPMYQAVGRRALSFSCGP